MRKIGVLVAAACAFGVVPWLGGLGNVAGSLALLALAVALAFAASSGFFAVAAAGGALGAFASAVLSPVSPAVGGAALIGLAFAERTMRVRGRTARLTHVGAALLGGALAGSLSSAFASASLAVRVVAAVVAAVLVALPLLVEADDPIAHTLEDASTFVVQPAQTTLREAAELRRNSREVPLDPETARTVQRTWRSLLRLGEARVRLERTRATLVTAGSPALAVVTMLDQKLADHTAALARAVAALDAARAAEVGLDDAALKTAETHGESLEEASRAILDAKL
jgi:MFS family permease